jgi:hypothetical protein
MAASPIPISDPQFIKAIRSKIDGLLVDYELYELSSYGWKGPDECDDEFVGHAMWQTAPPIQWDFLLDFDDKSPAPTFEHWLRSLAVSGADFEGLMIAGRLSIGLALFNKHVAEENLFSVDNFFQLHLMAAMMTLNAASDRLRDLFIAGVYRLETSAYTNQRSGESNRQARRRSAFVTPFSDARDEMAEWSGLRADLSASLAALPTLADRTQQYRQERNRIVHEVATELGKQERKLLEQVPQKLDYAAYEAMDHEALKHAAEIAETEQRKRITDDLVKPIEWYKLLIEMSNHVFVVQYWCRTLSLPPVVPR